MGNTSPEKGQTMFRALLMQKAKSQGINDPSFRISIDSGRSPTLSYTFKNPVTGQYSGIENVVIEWGDGTSTQLISEDDKNVTVEKLTHTYVEGKVWQIKMTSSDGKIPQFNFNTDTLLVSVDSSLCSMTARNGNPVTDFTNFFANCTNLGNVCGNLFSQNPNITSFNKCFYNCTSLKNLPSTVFAGCTKNTNMFQSFGNCTGLTALPAGLFSDFVNVSTYYSCFSTCTNLKTILSGLSIPIAASPIFRKPS